MKNKMTPSFILVGLCLFLAAQASLIAQNHIWAKSMGSQEYDSGRAIANDGSGNVYTTGFFGGTTDFDPGAGTYNLTATSFNERDIFISKLDAAGNFLWAKQISSSKEIHSLGIVVDGTGNVYTTGWFIGNVDFDPNAGIYNLSSSNIHMVIDDIFVSKLDAAGNFVWAKNIGSKFNNRGFNIALDNSGNVYITGGGGKISPLEDVTDIFVVKLDAKGSLLWTKKMDGSDSAYGSGITVDGSGNVYLTGSFSGTVDFDPNMGNNDLTSLGETDIFLSKLDAAGNVIWVKRMGGGDHDSANSIAIDGAGNVYLTGNFRGIADFDPNGGASILTSVGLANIFISKLDGSGNLVWAKGMSGINYGYASDITVDGSGNVYTTGIFSGIVDFDPNLGNYDLTSAGQSDIFISKLDAAGNLVWARSMGGFGYDYADGIGIDGSGNVYTTGSFSGTVDFDPNAGTANLTSVRLNDIFISKLSAVISKSKDINESLKIKTFPNPFDLVLNIELPHDNILKGEVLINIYDINGKQVMNKKGIALTKGNIYSLPTPDLAPGSYLIRVQVGNNVAQNMIIKHE